MDDSLRYRKYAKYIALAFGFFLIGAETLRNWSEWPRWQNYAFDYGFAVILIALSLTVHRTKILGLSLMTIVWLLIIFVFSWSLIGHIKNFDKPTYGLIEQVPLTIGIGVLDLVAVLGVTFTIMAICKTMQSKHNGS